MSLKIGLVFIRVAVTSLSKDFLEVTYVPYLTSWKGRYKIPHPTGRYKFLSRAPKAQGKEIFYLPTG